MPFANQKRVLCKGGKTRRLKLIRLNHKGDEKPNNFPDARSVTQMDYARSRPGVKTAARHHKDLRAGLDSAALRMIASSLSGGSALLTKPSAPAS